MADSQQVEINQLITYRLAALFAFPKRMLAVHIFMAFPAFNTECLYFYVKAIMAEVII